MQMALQLAGYARGQTAPNPLVGAVLVKENRIVGFGAHLAAGTPHAEVHALNMAGDSARGATLYVTLEPCSHFGRTPPCADAVIAHGVETVYVAMVDPFPAVSGRGIERLRSAAVHVHVGLLADEATLLNAPYLQFVRSGRPYVTWKSAMTQDGYIAATETANQDRYLSGAASRAQVHALRNQVDAIGVGVGTILADDPELTTRLPDEGGRHPQRIVFDSQLRTPPGARLLRAPGKPTWILCGDSASEKAAADLEEAGAIVIRLPTVGSRINLSAALQELALRSVVHLLLEGGSKLTSGFLQAQLIDEVWLFHTPHLFGSGIKGFHSVLTDAAVGSVRLTNVRVTQVGEDSLTIGQIRYGR